VAKAQSRVAELLISRLVAPRRPVHRLRVSPRLRAGARATTALRAVSLRTSPATATGRRRRVVGGGLVSGARRRQRSRYRRSRYTRVNAPPCGSEI
jgi:hypothetical protein